MHGRIGVFAIVALAAIAVFAPGAQGATTLGSSLSAFPDDGPVFCPGSCSSAQMELPGRAVAAPADGVLVRWRIRTDSPGGPFALRVMRPGSGTTLTAIDKSLSAVTAAAGVSEFGTRLPIKQGDRIGLHFTQANTASFKPGTGVTGAFAYYFSPDLSNDETRPATVVNVDTELLFNADFEPDADGDRYGDETQDICPGITGTYNGCTGSNPVIVSSAAKRQRIKNLAGSVTLDRVASVSTQAVVKYNIGKKRIETKSKKAAAMVGPGVKTKFATKFTKSQRAKMTARLKLKQKLTAVITYTVVDALGQQSRARSTVSLKL